MIIDPKDISVQLMHGYLLGAVVPRPIALASTIDEEGNVNLSPFSFFNCFGSNPPIVIFSPSRRVRDDSTKHTYENVKKVPEVVIHIVSYSMVEQVSLASGEYPANVNEFHKAGFTQIQSEKVRPPRVGESPVAMECLVKQVIETGDKGGAGALVICEVALMHIDDKVLTDGKIDPFKMDAVSRLGGDYYARINHDSIFTVPKPSQVPGIGFDALPAEIRNSTILTGNDLARLAGVHHLPVGVFSRNDERHQKARRLLEDNKVDDAWKALMEENQEQG